MENLLNLLTVENISFAISAILALITFIIEWKRRGIKQALEGMIQTIQKGKHDITDPTLNASANKIAAEIKKDWNVESENSNVAKVGKTIDNVYNQVKDVNAWLDKYKTQRLVKPEVKVEETKKT